MPRTSDSREIFSIAEPVPLALLLVSPPPFPPLLAKDWLNDCESLPSRCFCTTISAAALKSALPLPLPLPLPARPPPFFVGLLVADAGADLGTELSCEVCNCGFGLELRTGAADVGVGARAGAGAGAGVRVGVGARAASELISIESLKLWFCCRLPSARPCPRVPVLVRARACSLS